MHWDRATCQACVPSLSVSSSARGSGLWRPGWGRPAHRPRQVPWTPGPLALRLFQEFPVQRKRHQNNRNHVHVSRKCTHNVKPVSWGVCCCKKLIPGKLESKKKTNEKRKTSLRVPSPRENRSEPFCHIFFEEL